MREYLNELDKYCQDCLHTVTQIGEGLFFCEACNEIVSPIDAYEAQSAMDYEAGAWEYVDNGW